MVRKIKGYTTLELLIVIAFLAILSVIFIREFLIYTARERLKGAANEIASQLNWAKTRSMISTALYGMCYDNNTRSFIFFEERNGDGKYSNGTDGVYKILNVDDWDWKGVEVVDIDSRAICPQAIIFDRRGELLSEGTTGTTITFGNNFGERISVVISSLGRITVRYGS